MRALSFAAAAALAIVAACTQYGTQVPLDDAGVAPVDAGKPADAAVDAGAVKFAACPGAYSGACATIQVPLDWSAPDGKKIPILVDKIATAAKPKAQLWMLQGGPGGSGADLVPLAVQLARLRGDIDVFTIDHRGVGASSRLGCPQEGAILDAGAGASLDGGPPVWPTPDENAQLWSQCLTSVKAQWGDDLRHFTTSNAARDLEYVIRATKDPAPKKIVYGVSYGTYWLHRYLQIFPEGLDGAILDSIVPADGEFLSRFDLHGDLAGQKLAEVCKTDANCSSHLGADPWAHLQQIRDMFDAGGHCPESGLDASNRGQVFALLQNSDFRGLAFAMLARWERCNAADVAVIRRLFSKLSLLLRPPPTFSVVLGANVRYSELWEQPAPSVATLKERYDAAVFAAGSYGEAPVEAIWPHYADPLARQYATTKIPVLMLNGTMDVQTPIETAHLVADHLNAPGQTFVTVPGANHGVIVASPVKTIGAPPCGMQMIASFIDTPATPDQTCLGDLKAPSLAVPQDASTFFLATNDVWDGVPTQNRSLPTAPEIAPVVLPVTWGWLGPDLMRLR